MIGRDAILDLDDLGYQDVEVGAWGGLVRVRGMSLEELDRFQVAVAKTRDGVESKVRAQAITWCVLTTEGKRLFRDEDADRIAAHGSRIYLALWNVIADLSGLSQTAEEALGKGLPKVGSSVSTSPPASAEPSGSSS